MTSALIGYTGFVGSNLLPGSFDAVYNSKNISEIRGRSFDRVTCAGVTALKWWANKNAEEDRQRIAELIHDLCRVEVAQFTLISTVDVYHCPIGADESTIPEPVQAYGANRLLLEQFVADQFSCHTIARLPALVGQGLVKNAIFDLLNDNMLELVHPESSFQWYPLDRLPLDLIIAEINNLPVINFATEPVTMREVRDWFFPGKKIGGAAGAPATYDFRTKYASVFGGMNGYILNHDQVMVALGKFIAGARS